MTLDQVQGLVQLASGAVAVGFAALARTLGQGAAQKPLPGGQLRNPGTEVALGGGELSAAAGVVHLL